MRILVVTKFAARGRSRDEIIQWLTEAGFAATDFVFEGAVTNDHPWDAPINRNDLKEGRARITDFVKRWNPDAILGMGNEGLFVTTGHSGIMNWRGKVVPHPGVPTVPVLATVAPAAVFRQPSLVYTLQADVKHLFNHVHNITVKDNEPDRHHYHVIDTKPKLRGFLDHLRFGTAAVSIDVETKDFDEWKEGSFVVSIAVTTLGKTGAMHAYAVPLHHRASVWRTHWQSVLRAICGALREVPVRIAHNAKFDCRWLAEFTRGVPVNFDTMLAAHVLDENRVKGLKPLAQLLLQAPQWDISTKSGKNALPWYEQHTIADILKYNMLDTWHTMRLYLLFKPELEKQPRLDRLFRVLMMPASQSLVHVERRGIFIDQTELAVSAGVVQGNLADLETRLNDFVPAERPYEINWNPSSFLRWFLFDYQQYPVLARGKAKPNGMPGDPSVAEDVMATLAEQFPEDAIPALLVERVKWQKMNSSFINPYLELTTPDSRIKTVFKLSGTVTGRLASGKQDLDKVVGAKKVRGVNIQQVPRDPLIRGLFGAAPGWTFIEADYSQIELRLAAFIANEPTMLALYAAGEDIHMATAMKMTGKPASQVTSEERKKAKAVNFGFLYGMGAAMFVDQAWKNYGLRVTMAEAQAFRKAFFAQFPELLRWHGRQRRLVRKFHRVETPIGRVRHLPDITSPDRSVANEAERQAINSPVQGLGSDMCLTALVILDREFRRRNLRASVIGTVHDAINSECPDDELDIVLPLIKNTMENLPLKKLYDLDLTVPIVADVKVGARWGKTEEWKGAA